MPIRMRRHDRRIHVDELRLRMVGDVAQRIRIQREVDSNHVELPVHHVTGEAGTLLTESVVVLAPAAAR